MKMTYNQFCRYMQENILHYLPDEATISVKENVESNKGKEQFLDITHKEERFGVSINLNKFYQKYLGEKSVENICKDMADVYNRSFKLRPGLDMLTGMKYEKVKDHIIVNLVNYKNNQRLLEKGPYVKMEDFAVYFGINIIADDGQNIIIPITKEMQEKLRVSSDELYALALKNTERMYPAKISSIEDTITDIPEDIRKLLRCLGVYSMTNASECRGAATILYPDMPEKVKKNLGRDIYIVPASCNVVLLVPKTGVLNARMLEKMVRRINQRNPKKEEILSDHIYEMDCEKKKLQSVKGSMKKKRGIER